MSVDKPADIYTVRYVLHGIARVRATDQHGAECIAAGHLIGSEPTDAVLDNEVRSVDSTGWTTYLAAATRAALADRPTE